MFGKKMRKAHVIKMYWSFTGNRFYQESVHSCLDKRRKAYYIENSKTLVNYSEQVLLGKGSFMSDENDNSMFY